VIRLALGTLLRYVAERTPSVFTSTSQLSTQVLDAMWMRDLGNELCVPLLMYMVVIVLHPVHHARTRVILLDWRIPGPKEAWSVGATRLFKM